MSSSAVPSDVVTATAGPDPAAASLASTDLAKPADGGVVPGAAVVPPRILVPSLRGTMFKEGNGIICRGMWAMSDEQHVTPDLTSEFEFRLVNANDPSAISSGTFPVGGLYQGWFKLRKVLPLKGFEKIDDKGITINFEPVTPDEREETMNGIAGSSSGAELYNRDADIKVMGKGQNKFGTFTLKGWLDSKTGTIIMYREYVPKPVKIRVKTESKPKVATNTVITPREGTGRIRKQSSLVKDFDVGGQPPAKVPKTSSLSKEETKAQKLKEQLQKCATLLEEITKHPKAAYFAEPVDPIKLNIPDYALVITRPMDLSTVRNNITSHEYKSPSEFAEHMRLIFKNAIAYNSLRDNPVHIAARELAKIFEEKYRAIVAAAMSEAKAKPLLNKTKKQQKVPLGFGAMPKGSYPQEMPLLPPKRTKGPNPAAMGLPPDGSMVQMQEMQRKMIEMQRELLSLRTAVAQEQVKGSLDQRQAESQNPLTLEEKEALIESINTLPAVDMERVITIIQEAAPRGQEAGEDVEIPLDELDTHTLRKLQAYVRSVKGDRKGAYMDVAAYSGAASSANETIGLGFEF